MFSKRVIQCLLVSVCFSMVNISCAQQVTHREPIKNNEKIIEVIRQAPLSIVLDPEGGSTVVGKGLERGKPCFKDAKEAKRNGGKQCSVFSQERKLEDVQTFTVIKSKGSFIYCYYDSSGAYQEICYDDNYKRTDCPR